MVWVSSAIENAFNGRCGVLFWAELDALCVRESWYRLRLWRLFRERLIWVRGTCGDSVRRGFVVPGV